MGVPHPRQITENLVKKPEKWQIWESQEKIFKILTFLEKYFRDFQNTGSWGTKNIKIKKNSRKSTDLDEYMLFKKISSKNIK